MAFDIGTGIDTIKNSFGALLGKVKSFVSEKPIQSGVALAGAGLIIPATALGISKLTANGKRKRRRKAKGKKTRGHRHRRSRSRRIVRGRGLGYGEIHHGHRGSKLVSFRTKSGKLVRFRVKGSQKKHLGSRRRRRKR